MMAKLAAARAAEHKKREEQLIIDEAERKAEEERKRKEKEEEERIRQEEKQKEIEVARAEYLRRKAEGDFLSEKEKLKRAKDEQARQELLKQIKSQESAAANRKDNKKEHYKKKKKPVKVEAEEAKDVPEESKTEHEEKKEEKEEEEQVDVDWEELAENTDRIDAIIKPKLSMDLTEITTDNLSNTEGNEAKESEVKEEETKEEPTKLPEKAPEKAPEKEAPKKQPAPKKESKEERKKVEVRAPILCVLGHVDTGKTKILDKIRKTKVQEGEVGGITQQIGATLFPRETLEEHANSIKGILDVKIKIPGFLVIDTPGHESFSNLRNRGSTLCDFAILIVDIMHGLENQTVESLNILKKYKIPFVVALNKIDRCYDWKGIEYASSKASYERNTQCQQQFNTLMNKVILQFAEQEVNACLYWKNDDPESFVSMVPTSAITGEGIPDLLTYTVKRIQETLARKIIYQPKLVCTVMEVKVLEGYGVTCDVILVTGELHVNDMIILSGFEGPIVATVRALLTPKPLKEMRVKGEYVHHESVRGTIGVKVCAPGLEDALAGSPLYCAHNEEEVEEYKREAGEELAAMIRKYISKHGEGIYVQSSTLGSLEALLELLKSNKIPVSGIGLGPLYKKHILKVMKASEKKGDREEYATILAFEVEPDKEADELIKKNSIKLFKASVVYHLIDSYKKHADECLYSL
eukprot:TRINITY_DN2036_c0_g1_i4.p1 TRINITY_DN2036_c0_g1~~TRINITY_DN2036_c0_g1_i4.p1  ORF type:complete len:695 (-),score=291.59 TRINITY_DN2036_c0_g1_i4:645-2729(-)